jgi:hypothetical protein
MSNDIWSRTAGFDMVICSESIDSNTFNALSMSNILSLMDVAPALPLVFDLVLLFIIAAFLAFCAAKFWDI